MSRLATKIANVYLIGLPPAEEGYIWENVQRKPLPRWSFSILDLNAPLPPDVVDGRAVLLVGCDRTTGRSHGDTIQLLRLLMPNNPWFALGPNVDESMEWMARSVGALSFIAQPFKLHQLPPVLEQAALHVGRVGPKPLTCALVLRYAMFFGANATLRFRMEDDRTSGYVVLRNGQPFHARLADGSSGAAALRALASWGVGKVSSAPLPNNFPRNIADDFDCWLETTPADEQPDLIAATPQETVTVPVHALPPLQNLIVPPPPKTDPMGMAIADRMVHDLDDTYWCYVVDTTTNRIVGMPPGETPSEEIEEEIVTAMQQLLEWPGASPTGEESVKEVVISSRSGWCAAFALEGSPLVVVLSAFGQLQSVMAQNIIAAVMRSQTPSSALVNAS